MPDCRTFPLLLNATTTTTAYDAEGIECLRNEMNAIFARGCTCADIAMANEGVMFKCFDSFDQPLPGWIQNCLLCTFAFVALLSLLANSIVVWIILAHPVMRNRNNNKYVLNLAFSDLCLTLFNTLPLGFTNVLEYWPFPCWSCRLLQMLGVLPYFASVFTMLLISHDRYNAILYPLHHQQQQQSAESNCQWPVFLTLSAIWALGLACALPQLFIYECFREVLVIGLDEDGNRTLKGLSNFCEFRSNVLNEIYSWAILTVQFLVPICVLTFAYGRIAVELYRPGPAAGAGGSAGDSILKAKKRTAKLLALMVFSFLILWLPYELLSHVFFVVPHQLLTNHWSFALKLLFNAAFVGAMSSTLISPLVYFEISQRFRVGFRYALRWVPLWRGGGITKAQYREVFAITPDRSPHHSRRRSTCDTSITALRLQQK